ncbi:hypothetical protein GOV04_00775 [Candidatus Woesearchaeota archaeon]|nr:hypothetical protein [Candidatus Woesearchaeota archaeon]
MNLEDSVCEQSKESFFARKWCEIKENPYYNASVSAGLIAKTVGAAIVAHELDEITAKFLSSNAGNIVETFLLPKLSGICFHTARGATSFFLEGNRRKEANISFIKEELEFISVKSIPNASLLAPATFLSYFGLQYLVGPEIAAVIATLTLAPAYVTLLNDVAKYRTKETLQYYGDKLEQYIGPSGESQAKIFEGLESFC